MDAAKPSTSTKATLIIVNAILGFIALFALPSIFYFPLMLQSEHLRNNSQIFYVAMAALSYLVLYVFALYTSILLYKKRHTKIALIVALIPIISLVLMVHGQMQLHAICQTNVQCYQNMLAP